MNMYIFQFHLHCEVVTSFLHISKFDAYNDNMIVICNLPKLLLCKRKFYTSHWNARNMIDWALETYTLIGEEQPQELMDRPFCDHTELLARRNVKGGYVAVYIYMIVL